MAARIFRPSRSAVQSGRAKSARWVLVHVPQAGNAVDPLMGYTSGADMQGEVRLTFATLDDAVAYAERQGIAYSVEPAHERAVRGAAYADNFSFARPEPWTH
ncbi:MAG: ETC complex I subunit [Bauldia sp.]